MKRQHLTLMHGGRCPCERCRFQHRALLIVVLLLGACLGMLATWLDAQWLRWVVNR